MRLGRAIPRFYYLLTPAYIALDYAAGINIRTAALDTMPLYKNLYYGFCILCAVVALVWAGATPVVALVESSIIIVITIVSALMPVFEVFRQAAEPGGDWQPIEVFDPEKVTNLMTAGMIAVIAFRMNVATVASPGDPGDRGKI